MFNKINLRKDYHRIRMKEKKKWKTAFKIKYEYYEYQIMFFELINASATMQTLMNDILKEFLNDFVIVYFQWYINILSNWKKTRSARKKNIEQIIKQQNVDQYKKVRMARKKSRIPGTHNNHERNTNEFS